MLNSNAKEFHCSLFKSCKAINKMFSFCIEREPVQSNIIICKHAAGFFACLFGEF